MLHTVDVPKVEACAIFPVAHLVHLVPHAFGKAVVLRILFKDVCRHAVGIGHHCHIVGGLCTPLYLEGGDPRLCQPVKVLYHAQILGIEDECALLVLVHGEKLPRAGLLHKVITPAAGLGTAPTVGIPPRKVGGYKAPP